jgi:hypothetical protein
MRLKSKCGRTFCSATSRSACLSLFCDHEARGDDLHDGRNQEASMLAAIVACAEQAFRDKSNIMPGHCETHGSPPLNAWMAQITYISAQALCQRGFFFNNQ